MCWCNREMCDHGDREIDDYRWRELEQQKMAEQSWRVSSDLQEEVFRMIWLEPNNTLAHRIQQMPALPDSKERLVACGDELANLMRNGKLSEHLALWILEYLASKAQQCDPQKTTQELLYGKVRDKNAIDSLEKAEDFQEYFRGWTEEWVKFWKKFGFTVDLRKVSIPPISKTHALTVVVPEGLTIKIAMKIMKTIGIHVQNKIESLETIMPRRILQAYGIRVRGGLFSPYTHAYENVSAKGLSLTNEDCMNLLEYLVLIARRHMEQNMKDEGDRDSLNNGAHMLCAGSCANRWVPKIDLERGREMYLSLVPSWLRQEGVGAYSVLRRRQERQNVLV